MLHFQSSIKHRFAWEIRDPTIDFRKRKVPMNQAKEDASRLSLKKLEVFQKVAELVYRTRNKAHEIAKDRKPRPKDINELFSLLDALLEFMFQEAYYLEKFSCFALVHSYKNLLVTFYSAIYGDTDNDKTNGDLDSKYDALEKGYLAVIDYIKMTGDHPISTSNPSEQSK